MENPKNAALAHKLSSSSALEALPNELLLEIMRDLSPNDSKSVRLASKRLGPFTELRIFETLVFDNTRATALKTRSIIRHPFFLHYVKCIVYIINPHWGTAGKRNLKAPRDILLESLFEIPEDAIEDPEYWEEEDEFISELTLRTVAVDVRDPGDFKSILKTSVPAGLCGDQLRRCQWSAIEACHQDYDGLNALFGHGTRWRPTLLEMRVLKAAFKRCSRLRTLVYDVDYQVKYDDENDDEADE